MSETDQNITFRLALTADMTMISIVITANNPLTPNDIRATLKALEQQLPSEDNNAT